MAHYPLPYRNSHALLIGIDAYPPHFPSLHIAVEDVRGLARLLQDNFDFPPQNIIPLEDQQATRGTVQRCLVDPLSRMLGGVVHGMTLTLSSCGARTAAWSLQSPRMAPAAFAAPCRIAYGAGSPNGRPATNSRAQLAGRNSICWVIASFERIAP